MCQLKPAGANPYTAYRYYSTDQWALLNRILALKELGFTLEQIARLLDGDLPVAEIRGMFKLKRAEIEQLVQEEQARLARLDARLALIEMEEKWPAYEVIIKQAAPCKVAAIRAVLPAVTDIGSLFDELSARVRTQGLSVAGYPFATWYGSYYQERDIDIEIALPVGELRLGGSRMRFHELPGGDPLACVVHHGDYGTIDA